MGIGYKLNALKSAVRLPAGGVTPTVIYASDDGILLAFGTTVPSDSAAGYATGCLFLHTDGGAGSSLYVNEGSATSADFDAVAGA